MDNKIKKQITLTIINVVLYGIAIYLTFLWFNYKLFVVMIFWLWANNLSKTLAK